MNAIILSVGTELTSGQTVDTNSAWLSRKLAGFGIVATEHRTLGDDRAAVAEAITATAGRCDLLIITGGLGPTEDDITRQGLADAMGVELVMNDKCLAELEAFFAQRNRPMHAINRVQAMLPVGARALDNPAGTAPGIAATVGSTPIYVMPGVPFEMERMFDEQIAPLLPRHGGVAVYRVLHTFGAGESDLGAKIGDLMRRDANPLVGTTVAAGLVSIRIITCDASTAEAVAMTDKVAAELRSRLGTLVFGQDDEKMAGVLGDMLRQKRQTLATAESCTGGLLGKMLTDIPGSSEYYIGGIISYSNALKEQLLGVDAELLAEHGAVSEPVAAAMAEGCRLGLGSDWAISITGVAGPGGGSEQKPVGLVFIGLAGPDGTQVFKQTWPGTREIVRLRSALAGMNYLRLRLA